MGNRKFYIGRGCIFTILLFVTFLVLKVTNVITWSWVWVTAPIWVFPALVLGIIFLLILIFVLVIFLGKY